MGNKRKDGEVNSDDSSRKRRTTTGDDDNDKLPGKPQLLPSMIKNKHKRSAVYAKIKHDKKLDKKKNAKARQALETRAIELGEDVLLHFTFNLFSCTI